MGIITSHNFEIDSHTKVPAFANAREEDDLHEKIKSATTVMGSSLSKNIPAASIRQRGQRGGGGGGGVPWYTILQLLIMVRPGCL